jgi:hypothetical protein
MVNMGVKALCFDDQLWQRASIVFGHDEDAGENRRTILSRNGVEKGGANRPLFYGVGL